MTDELALRERLASTLQAVAEQTTVTDKGVVPAPVDDAPRPRMAGERHRLGVAAAAVVVGAACLSVLGAMVLFGSEKSTEVDTVGVPPSPTSRLTEVAAGVEAYVIPPAAIDGLPLAGIHQSWSLVEGGSEPDDRFARHMSVGRWQVPWRGPSETRELTYRYSLDAQIQGAPEVWIGVVAPATLDPDEVRSGASERPERLVGRDGLEFLDLGVVCPDALAAVGSMLGWPTSTCHRRAVGIGRDFLVEVALPEGSDLHAIVAELSVGSLDELREAAGPVDGLDQVSSSVPVVRVEPEQPPPDTPFCNQWLEVLALARSGVSPYSVEMTDSLSTAADLAPPELAAQIRDLANRWSTTGPDAPRDQETATLMMDVTNAAGAECPGIQAWTDE